MTAFPVVGRGTVLTSPRSRSLRQPPFPGDSLDVSSYADRAGRRIRLTFLR